MASRVARTSSPFPKSKTAVRHPFTPPPSFAAPVPVAPPLPKSAASRLCTFMEVWWSLIFAVGIFAFQLIVEPKQGFSWPPKLDLSGKQAMHVLSCKWVWACWIPLTSGIFWLRSFFNDKTRNVKTVERGMMMWWLTNALFFHLHCDILSGYFQVMPIMKDFYAEISPAHLEERWADARLNLDSTYLLEMIAEVPLALITLFLYHQRHSARYLVECFALAVQASGTAIYYFPRFMRQEAVHSWLTYCDLAFGSVWVFFPLAVLVRHFCSAVPGAGAEKKS